MSSRTVIFAVVAFALANAGLGPRASGLGVEQSEARGLRPEDFETPADVTLTPSGMLVAPAPTHTIALARVAADGSIVIVCVESNEAAQTFLHQEQAAEPHTAQKK